MSGLPIIRNLGNPWRGRACVLCYHRVMPDIEIDKSPNSNLIIPNSRFAKQMEYLSKKHNVVSIDELVEHLEGDSNKFVVAVTFDDGYKDNLTHALPILEKFQIPATIYISTRFPEGDTSLWWYEIWDYLKEEKVLEINYLEKIKKWNIGNLKKKIICFRELSEWIMKLSFKQQNKALEIITNDKQRKQYPQLVLNWNEIKILDHNPLVSIGAHTHCHLDLKQLDEKEAYSEIKVSKTILEQKLRHPIEHLAYPFGTAEEADEREFELAYRCGFKDAVTTRPEEINSPNLFAIPRVGVPNYLTLNGLIGKLSGWEYLIRKVK